LFGNVFGSDPPQLEVGIGHHHNGEPMGTARNILDTGEFVVPVMTEDLLAAMNISAARSPAVHCRTTDHFELPRISHGQQLTHAPSA
jgi:flavin reductase (DIM6/NTAB) family NADH-FMN oxidoreductase RutF